MPTAFSHLRKDCFIIARSCHFYIFICLSAKGSDLIVRELQEVFVVICFLVDYCFRFTCYQIKTK